MKNLTFLKLFLTTMFVMTAAFFTSCVDDNDDTEAPYLKVSPTTLVFDTDGKPVEGSQSSFEISTNRHWTATVADDVTWVTLSKMEGDGSATIQVSIPEGITDQAKVLIQMSNKVGVLMTETVTIRSGNLLPETLIYSETFGTTAPSKSPYPFVDEFTGWDKSGDGSGTVFYSGSGSSIRQSGKLSAGYEGASGSDKLFFGASANFVINKITLNEGQTNLKLTFGGSYSKNTSGVYDNEFKPELFHLYLSADGANWSNAVTYTTQQADEFWILATANFTLKNPVTELYVKFAADEASVFAIDDPTLKTGQGGQEIELGNGGGETPELGENVTIPELIARMTADKVVLDDNADHYLVGVVQNDVAGGNYSFNNLILATQNATTANNGLTLYGSQVEPSTLGLNKGDIVKVTLKKGLAQLQNYSGMYEVTGDKTADWATVEKTGTTTIKPITITADKLADYQGMTVTIQDATTAKGGVWAKTTEISSHTFTAAGSDFTVFCKKEATAFVDVPYKASTGTITGIAAVNKNVGQLVPRDLADVAAFNSTDPIIVSVNPTSLSFPATGDSKTIEVKVENQNNPIITTSGLSGILNSSVNGTIITVVAKANTGEAVNQTLKIQLQGGNSIDVPVTVAAPTSGGGYTLISDISQLTAGKYFMSGYAEINNSKDDLKPYVYQVWTGSVSFTGTGTTSNSDLVTVPYEYNNNDLTPKDNAKLASEMELVAVTGKANTYYIKANGKYLYSSVTATNRRLYFQDTPDGAEWEFMNKSNGDGITGSNNGAWIITAGADSNFLRSYKTETQTKVGFFFFKKN